MATGQPIGGTTVADPSGYGLGVAQQTSRQTGPFWYYQGQALGARVLQMYFPRSGMIIALGGQQLDRQRPPERPGRVGLPDPAGSRRSPHRLIFSARTAGIGHITRLAGTRGPGTPRPVATGGEGPLQRMLLRLVMARPWVAASWKAYLPNLYAGQRPLDLDQHRSEVVASLHKPGHAKALSLTAQTSHQQAGRATSRPRAGLAKSRCPFSSSRSSSTQ